MEYLKICEVAKKWGLSERGVQSLCAQGKIEGATRFGRSWMIPKNAKKPIDGRTKSGKAHVNEDMPLPRKTPFLYMSDLYHTPGTADSVGESLAYNHEAQVLFEAEVAYSRGDIDKVYASANYLLGKHSGFYAVLSAGMLLAQCAIWKGDIEMWRRAKVHIAEAPAKTDLDRDAMQLAISAVDIMLYNVENFPEWFKKGRFDPIHKDAYPAAKVYYAKYLYALGYAVAMGLVKVEGTQGLYIMSVISFSVEPMISWARANNTVMSEIY
ncbi:MAG: helix-turn-helix domain-containing protein, partial [Bacteroidaceae bacterium]|nr:helix-turn-helix domain-containing protein [Bacteroidaceae bacterium]